MGSPRATHLHEKTGRPCRIPLGAIQDLVSECNPRVERLDDGLLIAFQQLGVTELRVVPVDQDTSDGQCVADVIRIRTLLDDFLPTLPDQELADLNALASLGAVVRSEADGRRSRAGSRASRVTTTCGISTGRSSPSISGRT